MIQQLLSALKVALARLYEIEETEDLISNTTTEVYVEIEQAIAAAQVAVIEQAMNNLSAELEKAREALRYYANQGPDYDGLGDDGVVARDALGEHWK